MAKIPLLSHLNQAAQAAKSYTGGLIAQLAESVSAAIEELDSLKADKATYTAITIPVTGWQSDENGDYPQYYDITAEGITADDHVRIEIAITSYGTAKACGLCRASETLADTIRVRAVQIPAEAISAEYWIEN